MWMEVLPAAGSCVKPHAIALPLPEQGHINAMFHLCHHLCSHGFLVTFLTLRFFHQRILSHGLHLQTHGFRFMPLPDDLPSDFAFSGVPTPPILKAFTDSLTHLDPLILQVTKESEPHLPTCLIADIALLPAQDLADKLHLPRVAFSPFSATAYTLYTHVPEIISSAFNPFTHKVKYGSKSRDAIDLISVIPSLPPMHPADFCFKHPASEETEVWFPSWTAAIRFHEPEAAWTLCNTFVELENSAIDYLKMKTNGKFLSVGPLAPSFLFEDQNSSTKNGASLLTTDDKCLEWLQRQPTASVLYISLGSLVELSDEQLKELYLGLLDSHQHFLFVLRSADQAKILDTHQDGCERGMIIQWAPQAQVLAHPAVGGFLTHCGWNSTIEGISSAVPLLCWPFRWEQLTNCFLIVKEWKIGVEIEWEEGALVNKAEVERAVRRLMQEEEGMEIRERSKEMRSKAIKAHNNSSEMQIQMFVENMKARAQRKWMNLMDIL